MKRQSLKQRQQEQKRLKSKIIEKLNRTLENIDPNKPIELKVYKKMSIQTIRKRQKRLVGVIKKIYPCYKGIPKKRPVSVKHKLHPTSALFVTNNQREHDFLNEF